MFHQPLRIKKEMNQMENKSTPYMIRLNVLQLAQDIVSQSVAKSGSTTSSSLMTEDVLKTAEKLYSFVNTRSSFSVNKETK